jgi:hypothetical protein
MEEIPDLGSGLGQSVQTILLSFPAGPANPRLPSFLKPFVPEPVKVSNDLICPEREPLAKGWRHAVMSIANNRKWK